MISSSSHRSLQASDIGREPGVHLVSSRESNGVSLASDGVSYGVSVASSHRSLQASDIGREPGVHRGRFGTLSLSRANRGRIGRRERNGDIGREPGVHFVRDVLSLSRANRGRIGRCERNGDIGREPGVHSLASVNRTTHPQ